MTLITPLNCPLPTHHPPAPNKHSTQWQTEDIGVIVPERAPPSAKRSPLLFPSNLISQFFGGVSRPPVGSKTNARMHWKLDNKPPPTFQPHMVVEDKSPLLFPQVDTESPLLLCEAITHLSKPALAVPLPKDPPYELYIPNKATLALCFSKGPPKWCMCLSLDHSCLEQRSI